MAKPRSSVKRDQIFHAALKLFAHNGYSKTTIKDIANEADVSFGTVFTYYENKERLFYACLTEPFEEFRTLMTVSRKTLEELTLEKLKGLIEKHVDFFLEKEHYLRVVQYVIGQPERFAEIKELDQFSEEFTSFIQDVVKIGMRKGFLPASNPEEVGYGYLSFLMGARLTFTDYANVQLTNAFKNQALRLFGIIN